MHGCVCLIGISPSNIRGGILSLIMGVRTRVRAYAGIPEISRDESGGLLVP